MSSLIVLLTTEPAVYYLPFVYAIGLMGNIVNVLVFCQSKLRSNSCSVYFVCLSLSHLLLLNCPCLFRIVAVANRFNVFSRVDVLCKLSTYFDVLSLLLSRNFLCLICINRWMITSPNPRLRRQSSPRIARWTVVITLFICLMFNIHSAIGYYSANGIVCVGARDYMIFSSICHIVIAAVPLIVMIVFSLLTLINLQRIGRRTEPVVTLNPSSLVGIRSRRKRELQFIRLSLLQVLFYILLNSLRTVMPIVVYYITIVNSGSSSEREIMYFFFYWGTYLLYTYAAITWILYSLGSIAYREVCIATLKQYFAPIQRRIHHQ